MESIVEEIKRSQPRNYIINQLLKLTSDVRRQKIKSYIGLAGGVSFFQTEKNGYIHKHIIYLWYSHSFLQ